MASPTALELNRRDLLKVTGAGTIGVGTLSRVRTARAAADGPTVYVGSNDSNLYAVDAATGKEAWTFTESADWVYSSPTVVAGTVFVGSREGTLYAVDAASGEKEWGLGLSKINTSPTVVDETVYVGTYRAILYAVDAATGEEKWAFSESPGSVGTPTVVDGTVYAPSANGILYAIDAASGEAAWDEPFTEPGPLVAAAPTVVDGTVYVGSTDETLYAVDAASGEEAWTFTEPTDRILSSATVVEGTVYVGSEDGTLYAVDAASGEKEWEFNEPADKVNSSPTVVAGTVYVGSYDGRLYAVDAASGEKEWAFDEPTDWVYSSPTVLDETIYVGSADETLYAVDATTGEAAWDEPFTRPTAQVMSSPTVVEDPSDGNSAGSRVRLGTLGHHHELTRAPMGDPALSDLSVESVTTAPVFPNPGGDVRVDAFLVTGGELDAEIPIALSIDETIVERTTISGITTDARRVAIESETSLAPGEHSFTVVVDPDDEVAAVPGSPAGTHTTSGPPLAVEEFYTETPIPDPDQRALSPGNAHTTLQLSNPTPEPVSVDITLDVERTATTATDSVTVPANATRRLLFWWNAEIGAIHELSLTLDIENGGQYHRTSVYESPEGERIRELPTEFAFSSGQGNFGGKRVEITELASANDVHLSTDTESGARTLLVPFYGSGDVMIRIFDGEQAELGKKQASVEDSGYSLVDIPIELAEETEFIIIQIEEQKSLADAGVALHPSNAAGDLVALFDALGEFVTTGSLPNRQPRSFTYRYVAVAEISGYPKSDALAEFERSIEEEYAWEETREAVIGTAGLVGGMADNTVGMVAEYISKAKDAVDALDIVGTLVEFSDLSFTNDDGVGRVDVYEYSEPPINATRTTNYENAVALRYVDVKTTGIQQGTATVTLEYDGESLETEDVSTDSLDLYAWDDEWTSLENVSVATDASQISGEITAADLTGTPILLQGRRGAASDGLGTALPDWAPLAGGGAVVAGIIAALSQYLRRDEADSDGEE